MAKNKKEVEIEDILNLIGLRNLDIIAKNNEFTEAILDSKILKQYNDFIKNSTTAEELQRFILENRESIDKDRFIFISALNLKDYIEQIDLTIAETKERQAPQDRKMAAIANLLEMRKKQEDIYKKITELGKNIAIIVSYNMYDPNTNSLTLIFKDSRELFTSKGINKNRNKKQFDKVDNDFKKIDSVNEQGIEYLFKKMVFTDIRAIFSIDPDDDKADEFIGQGIVSSVQDNALIKKGYVTIKNLQDIRANEDVNRYFELVNMLDTEELLPELIRLIRENSYYLNMDKLLLVSAFRYQYELEECNIEELEEDISQIDDSLTIEDYYESMNAVLQIIKKEIKKGSSKIDNELQFKVEKDGKIDYEDIRITYSVKDLDETISRFINGRYIKKKETDEIRTELLNGSMPISEVNTEIIELLRLNKEDEENILRQSTENAIFMIEYRGYDEGKILVLLNSREHIDDQLLAYLIQNNKISMNSVLELYSNNKINREFFKKFSEELNISSEELLSEINEEYLRLKKQKENSKEYQKTEQRLNAAIDIYKAINIEDKKEEELEEISNEVMYEIAENFEDDEEDILFYYEKGLITLTTVAEWNGEVYIEKLFNEGKISKDDLMTLFKKGKISNRLIEENFLEEDMLYDELMSLINQGGLSEDKIVNLYMTGRIFDVDFEEMLNARLVSHGKYFNAIESRTKQKLEENSKIVLSPDLTNIPDKSEINLNIIDDDSNNNNNNNGDVDSTYTLHTKSKLLIDPAIRYEFLRKLGALKANPIDLDPSNSFYNYEFFVIPNINGELDIDSVVIAERFYEDKETQRDFSFKNATYFFQYKDLMVNSNLSKKEMIKEREKVIFTAAHTSGRWAVSVLQKLAQTMLSTKFKKCRTEKEKDERAEMVLDQLHRILTPKQIKEVLDLAGEIDDEEKYTYELINDSYTVKDTGDVSDDSEQR